MRNYAPNLPSLWENYKKNGALEARDQIIIEYAPLIKYVAGRLAIGMPNNVDYDDLVGFGVFGLLDAVEKFEPERGIKFETYALARIRGAIIDGLRSMDWVPRSVRRKARELEKTVSRMDSQLGRPAEDSEIAAAMGYTIDEYFKVLQEVACTTLTSLDEVWLEEGREGDGVSLLEAIEDKSSPDPLDNVEFTDLRERMAASIDELPDRDRLVISLYYFEGLTLKEIGAVLDVSEARVSQIHSKAITRLRVKMRVKN